MHYPFLVADPHTGLHYRLSDARLAELSLAPRPVEWAPARVIAAMPDPVWADSLANAPSEMISTVITALEDLVLAAPDLRVPEVDGLPDSRAKRHLTALVNLWRQMADALPEGLAVARHVLDLPEGRFLDPLPVVEDSLDELAPAAMKALHDRLRAEFGAVPAHPAARAATEGSRLHALQGGLTAKDADIGPDDGSTAFYGLRDPASCADFAAARARALMEGGCPAREIALMTGGDTRQLARACAAQGVPLSGLPAMLPERDVQGETALHLLLAKRPPTPAMVLASIALSPLMPWSAQTGRDLAEALMGGDFRGQVLETAPDHKTLWDDIRASASSLPQLRFLMDRICQHLPDGDALRARLPTPMGDGNPDWEAILHGLQITSPATGEPVYNLEGVSLWSAHETPWRPCRHLIVTDFTEGLYPARPRTNPLFLDSEIAMIRDVAGLHLRGRSERLTRSLSLFEAQLRATSESVTFLIPWRDLSGGRLAASAGLSLAARVIDGVGNAADLITDLSRVPPVDWPVAHHLMPSAPEPSAIPEAISFPDHDLRMLRREEDGTMKPQSPSRLEVLVVSPLAWLLGELNAVDLSWSAERLDVMIKGNIAHDVFEHVFTPGQELPRPETLPEAVAEAYDRALTRHAGFLRGAAWEMERNGLEREIAQAALHWLDHLEALGAKILGNEVWLRGQAHGIRLHGKADAIIERPDGTLLVVDHKKSATAGRRRRMEAGWDLQAGLYRDMITHPIRTESDGMAPLIGRKIAVAYYLMNDGGLLTSGLGPVEDASARDMGAAVNQGVIECLAERLKELADGKIMLNAAEDEKFFSNTGGFTPYALTDGSPLVRAFMRPAKEA